MRVLSWAYLALAYVFIFLPVVVLVRLQLSGRPPAGAAVQGRDAGLVCQGPWR